MRRNGIPLTKSNRVILAAHIAKLCERHGIACTHIRRRRAEAHRRMRHIRTRPVVSEQTYAIALHEIGHVLGAERRHVLDKEVAAWEWARRHALIWTPRMQSEAASCLCSYLIDHPIWEWIEAVDAVRELAI